MDATTRAKGDGMTENDVRTLRGFAQGAANLKMERHPIFRTPSPMGGNQIAELFESISIMRLFLEEKYDLDFEKARQHFSEVRAKVFELYYQEQLKTLMQKEETARMAVEEGKRLLKETLVPFLLVDGLEKQVKWSDRITDDVMKQESPDDILTMAFAVSPSLGSIECISNPEKYLRWVREDFADHELTFRYERNLTTRQKEDGVKSSFDVVIVCKCVIKP
jgi:hypothetical protein